MEHSIGSRFRPVAPTLLLLAVAVVTAGCPRSTRRTLTPEIPTSGDAEARARFDQARARFARDNSEAIAEFEAIAEEYPEDPIAPWVLFYAGMSAVKAQSYEQALEHLEALADLDGDHDDNLGALRQRGRLYLGLAYGYLGQHQKALRLLRASKDAIVGPSERGEWLAGMAEALGRSAAPLDALEYYDRWYGKATRAEKAYIVSRLGAVVGQVEAEDAREAYEGLERRSGPAFAVLGSRVAADFAAGGQAELAKEIRAEIAPAREKIGLPDAMLAPARANPGLVGAVLPLTGRRARAGDLAMRGLALASGTFAGTTTDKEGRGMAAFVVTVRDSTSSVDGARAAVAEAAEGGVIAAVGPIDGRSVQAAATQASAAGLPLISLDQRSGQRIAQASRYVFHIVKSAEDRARVLARHGHDKGLRKFVILRPTTGYGRVVGKAFRDEIERLGAEIVADKTYDARATAFTDVAKEVSQAEPEAIFVPDQAERLELIAPALAVVDLKARPIGFRRRVRRGRKFVLLSTAELITPRYVRSSGRYSYGAVLAPGFYPDRADALIGDFTDRYQDSFGRLPSALDAYAYDAALVVRSAVTFGAQSRAELAQRMAESKVTGLTGTIAFDEDHRRSDPGLLFTVIKAGDDYAIRARRKGKDP